MSKASSVPSAETPGVVKTTTFREVLPSGTTTEERTGPKQPEFFEFVRSIPDEKLGEYMIYLYRVEPTRVQIDHTPGKTFDVPGYGLVPVIELEPIETAVIADCGGGTFRLICQKRSNGEWQTQTRFRIDLPPRNIVPWFVRRGENKVDDGKGSSQYPADGNQFASKALEIAASQEHRAVDLGLRLMDSAATHILKSHEPDEMERQFKAAMIQRALAPAPDPLDLMTKFMSLQSTLNPNSGGNPIMSKILDVALSRLLEPPMNSAPAVSAGAEMVRAVPTMISQVVEGIRELRMKSEAERDTAAIMQSRVQPARPMVMQPQILPAAPLPPPAPRVQPNPTPTQPNPTNGSHASGPVPFEAIEVKIMQILRMPISAEEAAERAIEYLEIIAGENPAPDQDYVSLLSSLGEPGLVDLFQRPNLRAANANTARLLDFIRAFLRYHAEDVAEEQQRASKPN